MTIKFRCEHCRQLLGIAKPRAGAMVDCPRCGRSLRVPSDADATASDGPLTDPPPVPGDEAVRNAAADAQRSEADDRFRQALASLAEFEIGDPPAVAPQAPSNDPGEGDSPESGSTVRTAENVGRLTDPAVNPMEEANRAIRAEEPDGAGSQQTAPGHAAEKSHTILEDPGVEMRPLRSAPVSADPAVRPPQGLSPPRRSASIWLVPLVAGLIVGCVAGWWSTRILNTRIASDHSLNSSAHSNAPDNGGRTAADVGTSDTRGDSQVTGVAGRTVQGEISWINGQGTVEPDSQALIIVLPRAHPGRLRLDGSSLRELQPDADQRALTAALAALGVQFVRADAEGRFGLSVAFEGPGVFVVVSRHQLRPGGTPIPAAVEDALGTFFQSSAAIVGRLASVVVAVPDATAASEPLRITL